MSYDIQPESAGSPFALFPFSPQDIDLYEQEEMTDPLVSIFTDNTELHVDTGLDNPEIWQNISQLSPFKSFSTDIEYGQVQSACISTTVPRTDDYHLTSLNDVTTSFDSMTSQSSDGDTSDNTGYSTPSPPTEETVSSKLKSVLMSRKRFHDFIHGQDGAASGTPNAEVSTIHNYSNSHPYRRQDQLQNSFTRKDNYQGGNKYYPHSSLRFPPCFVCGGIASGLHYGVNSCEPCKGFFTRYLRRKDDDFYKCAKDGNCKITDKLRGNCSACRLKKCLELGMSRKNSRLGRYSLSRRMETITKVNELDNNSINVSDVQKNPVFNTAQESITTEKVPGSDKYPEQSCKNEDLTKDSTIHKKKAFANFKLKAPSGFTNKLVRSLVEYMEAIKPYGDDLVTEDQIRDKLKSHYEEYKLKIEVFGDLKTVPKDEYFKLLKGFGIEIDKRMMFLKQSATEIMDIIGRYCNFAKQVPNFKALSNRDQSNLLKSSRYDFFMILMHEGYMHECQCFLAHNGLAFHREEVADKFFSRALVSTVCDMYHRLQKLKLSKEEKALLIAISLTFTDRCSLENPKLVEQIQLSLVQLLQRQLETVCPKSASRRFTKIIDCMTSMRESSELYLKEYNQLCQDESVIEEVPIMTELLFEDK